MVTGRIVTTMAEANHYCADCDSHFRASADSHIETYHAEAGYFRGILNGDYKDYRNATGPQIVPSGSVAVPGERDHKAAWSGYAVDLPKAGVHDRPADGQPPRWIAEYRGDLYDAVNVQGIDGQRHTLNCPCGCDGDVTVISGPDMRGDSAYIACTVDAVKYLKTQGSKGDGAA